MSNNQDREVVRLSVNVAPDVGTAIQQLAARHGITVTEVIRRAVSVLKFTDDEQAQGSLLLVKRGSAISEVTFSFEGS